MKNSMNEINGGPSSLKRKFMKCKREMKKSEYNGKKWKTEEGSPDL